MAGLSPVFIEGVVLLHAIAHRVKNKMKALLPSKDERSLLAARYLKGNGIEVGALHMPLWVPANARVRYVDRMSVPELRRHYPELEALPLVDVDIVDNGETLATLAAGSQDFIVSNHFIEHTQDPIATIKRHAAVLKPGGTLYLAVPDKRYTFDSDRPLTTLEHLIRDHTEGPSTSYDEHIAEYAALVDKRVGDDLRERIAFLKDTNYSIHFHVWTEATFKQLLEYLIKEAGVPLTLAAYRSNPDRQENIAILIRRP